MFWVLIWHLECPSGCLVCVIGFYGFLLKTRTDHSPRNVICNSHKMSAKVLFVLNRFTFWTTTNKWKKKHFLQSLTSWPTRRHQRAGRCRRRLRSRRCGRMRPRPRPRPRIGPERSSDYRSLPLWAFVAGHLQLCGWSTRQSQALLPQHNCYDVNTTCTYIGFIVFSNKGMILYLKENT